MSRLDDIVAQKRGEVAALRLNGRERELWAEADAASAPRKFRDALMAGRPSVIAEVKRASPSRGVITDDFAPVEIGKAYERGGADAVSVLTDERFFFGSNEHLRAVRRSIALPVLRKDFVIDALQVVEARALGADAILLIVRLLDDGSLRAWRELAASMGMDALVEVHDEHEARRAVDSGATLIGVNNRDLATFKVDLETSERVRHLIPSDVVKVSESGIQSPEDAARMFRAGYDAVLVGEGLVTAEDRALAVRRMKEHAGAGSLR
jgi:indole-3-glycerol phosphate synthase